METPKVSVLTPIYKTDPAYLRAAIRSVLDQTFADFEFILLDDCPDDLRESVVREFSDSRIVYLKNDRNLGITPSRNKLMSLARGEYFAVFDHDDVCRPERLEMQVSYLDEHPECAAVSGWTNEIPANRVAQYPESDLEIRRGMIGWCTLVHSASMLRRSALESAGIRYEDCYSPCEDYALFLKLLPHARLHNLQVPLIDYRLHATNATKMQSSKMIAADSLCRRWAERNLPDLYDWYLLHSREIRRIKFCGMLLVEKVSDYRSTIIKLFGWLPLIKIRTKRRMA